MAKRSKNSKETTRTFPISGMAFISDRTAILRPGFLEIILSGLSTLSILSTLIIPRSTPENTMETIEKHTIMKSIMFQLFLMYDSAPLNKNPYTETFKSISIVKIALTTKSI
jgi:hypothetical protein